MDASPSAMLRYRVHQRQSERTQSKLRVDSTPRGIGTLGQHPRIPHAFKIEKPCCRDAATPVASFKARGLIDGACEFHRALGRHRPQIPASAPADPGLLTLLGCWPRSPWGDPASDPVSFAPATAGAACRGYCWFAQSLVSPSNHRRGDTRLGRNHP